jgi:Protein of unknown function (DUF3667)
LIGLKWLLRLLDNMSNTCTNCSAELISKFCPECGQSIALKRIDKHYIMHEIEHLLHFERGILYTVKELCIRPGLTIRKYISENRSRLVKPIVFIIITSVIYTLINHYFHIEEQYVSHNGFEKSAVGKILNWVQNNYGYANIITGIFISLWLKVFFKKYPYNFFELLIMLCFIQGIAMLIFAVFGLLEGIFHLKLFSLAGIIGVVYLVWAIGDFIDAKKIASYTKALSAYLLGTITFYIAIFGIGFTIDALTKH